MTTLTAKSTRFKTCCGFYPIKSFHRQDAEWCVKIECVHCLTAIIHKIDDNRDMTAQLQTIARLWAVHQLAIQKFQQPATQPAQP